MIVLCLLLSCFLVSPSVYADIPPHPSPRFNWLDYGIIVFVGEGIAWLIGAECLWRITSKTVGAKQELTRPRIFGLMLLAMVLSFLIGLLYWKIIGWI